MPICCMGLQRSIPWPITNPSFTAFRWKSPPCAGEESDRRPLQMQFDPIHTATPTPPWLPSTYPIDLCLRPFHAFYCSSASKSFSYGRTNQRVLEASFPYFNRRGGKKGLRWPARPGLSSMSPDSFYRRLKTPRFAIQRKVVRSEDQNNAHDKHRPGKLEYFVKDAITRWSKHISEKDVASEFSMR